MPLNKYVLALVGGLVALASVGGGYLTNHNLTLAGIITVILPAGIIAVVGKLTDAEAIIGLNPTLSAVLLAFVAVMPLVQTSVADGVLTTGEVIAIVVAVINQIYHSLSPAEAVGPLKFTRG